MIVRKQLLAGAALAIALAVTGTVATGLAQNAAPTPSSPSGAPAHHTHAPGGHIDGRIAFLKAELKITDAQQPQFDKLAGVMRENSESMRQAFDSLRANRDAPSNAVQRLETRARLAALQSQASQRYLDAFKPLYDSLSDDQKQTADELIGHHNHGFRR
jgi:Spy/CpxP family protein refolding chaperone